MHRFFRRQKAEAAGPFHGPEKGWIFAAAAGECVLKEGPEYGRGKKVT